MCLGCSPIEMNTINFDTKTIRLCKDFIQNLWGQAEINIVK